MVNRHQVKRPLPFWFAVVVPATLAGHALAYALTGQNAADGHHGWMVAAWEASTALMIAAALFLTGESLLRRHILIHTDTEQSLLALSIRLALSQIALFSAMEAAEGTHVGIIGVLVQLVVAVAAAYMLSLFARMLVECARATKNVSRYLQRLLQAISSFVSRRPAQIAYTLFVRAGTARFQRPPPPFVV
jgi:hypothetical protein